MEWTDEGIVLGVRRHGESSAIVELLTRAHGRHLGLVRGGAGSRMRPLLQPGNSVGVVWRARLDEHLGTYAMLEHSLDDFDDIGSAAVHLIHFELAMLAELGFGLALENCAVTGETTDLIYVSPKSGGAVSRGAGEPWRDRLL